MNKSLVAGLCATVAVLASGSAFAGNPRAELLRKPALPPIYVDAASAHAACPTDQVVWLNWSAGNAHLPASKWYGQTKVGAYACEAPTTALGYQITD